jgi:membrane fusion protein, multidrug efflux system
VRAGRIVDEQWQVIEGLAPGDRIVVEGFQKFEPGDVVAPVPWQATRSAAESSTSDPERSQPVPVHYSPAR